MRRNKTWIVVLIIALILIGLNVWVFVQPEPEAPVSPEEVPAATPIELTVASSTKTVQGGTYGISLDFPVTNSESVNQQVLAYIDETVQAFEANVEEMGPSLFPDRQYTMFGTFETHQGATYTTFVFLTSVDTGGAHPNHTYTTYTFDAYGNVVTLADVLQARYGGALTLDGLSQIARAQLETELGEDAAYGWIATGTEPTIENYQDFYLTGDDLVILFEPYAVGPYAWSARMVRVTPELALPPQTETATTTASTTSETQD
ncbi:MAG: Peptidoglycan-N-acetylmuramic acid deacetylase PdaC [Candidatus Parcubacteria bacterium]|jgi:hypothetical protein